MWSSQRPVCHTSHVTYDDAARPKLMCARLPIPRRHAVSIRCRPDASRYAVPYSDGVEASSEGALSWRRLVAADLPLLAHWLRDPKVARWWNHEHSIEAVERDFGPSVQGEEPGEDHVVLLDDHPIGLLQRSVIRDYPEDLAEFEAVVDVPDGAVQLDYLIGDASLRGRGLGSRMIAAAIQSTWSDCPTAPAVLVAVVAANTASWRALEKAGMQRIAQGPMGPDKQVDEPLHYLYRVDRPG